jgi:hypothetical protein
MVDEPSGKGTSLRERPMESFRSRGMVVVLTLAVYLIVLMAFLQGHNFALGALIHVGSRFVSSPSSLGSVPVIADSYGYDGQFFYRLALDPLYKDAALSPRLDSPAYRQQRILYPLLVRALSLGNKDLVPFVMVGINLVSLGFLAWLGAEYAVRSGRSPAWGLFLSLYPGFLFSFLHDLPEPMAVAFLLAGLLAIRTRRPLLASAALMLAIQTRETVVVAAMAIWAAWLWRAAGRNLPPTESDAAGALRWHAASLPLAVFVLWQMVILFRWGHPSLVEGRGHIGVPLFGIAGAVWKLLPPFEKVFNAFDILLLLGFLLMGALAGMELLSPRNLLHEKVAFICYAVFALCFTPIIWEYRGGFLRALSEFYLLGFMLVTPSKAQLRRVLFGYWILLFLGTAIGYCLKSHPLG